MKDFIKTLSSCAFIFPILMFLSPHLAAATVNGTLGVTATVGAGCQVNAGVTSGGIIDFGILHFGSIYTLDDQHIEAQTSGQDNGSIVVECSDGTSFSISLDGGENFTGSSRAMAHATVSSTYLNYALYQNPQRTIEWPISSSLTDTASGEEKIFHIYGRIPAGQGSVADGEYADLVQVVVSW